MTNLDWKEKLIADSIALQKERKTLERARAEDQEIKNVELTMKKVGDALSALEQPYSDKLLDITRDIEMIHVLFIRDWDISDKTYKCDLGSATVRTTKSLKIIDKKGLITVLLSIAKLPEAIRTWNLSYLRKLKDVDMIEDAIASYDEHQNVVIKEVGTV